MTKIYIYNLKGQKKRQEERKEVRTFRKKGVLEKKVMAKYSYLR